MITPPAPEVAPTSPSATRDAPASPPRILIFDSGVGGLSILRAVQARLPGCDYVYACDNGAFPYGTKAADWLAARVECVLQTAIARAHPDLVVVACNTASTLVLERIRSHFANPVVGVVPAIKPAARLSASGVFGLLGTPGTVARAYTQQLIDDFAPRCRVVRVGSAELVEIAEAKLRGTAVDPARIAAIVAPLFTAPELDVVVLACTHFPLLRDDLAAAAPRAIQWIDSGDAIARRVEALVAAPAPAAPARTAAGGGFLTALFTARGGDLEPLRPVLASLGCRRLEWLSM